MTNLEAYEMDAIGHYYQMRLASDEVVAGEQQRPSILLKPELSIDGDQWCALFGANPQDGLVGFGDSPDEAYRAFDRAWYEKLTDKKGTK